jgi:hypothetical protein
MTFFKGTPFAARLSITGSIRYYALFFSLHPELFAKPSGDRLGRGFAVPALSASELPEPLLARALWTPAHQEPLPLPDYGCAHSCCGIPPVHR